MLEPGVTYEGRVSGTGLMLDGGYLYEAEHKCSLVVTECSGNCIKLKLTRTEFRKTINGENSTDLPEYLRLYLTTFGASEETVEGCIDPNGVIRAETKSIRVVLESDVYWSRRKYQLVASPDTLTGIVTDNESLSDRIDNGGVMLLRRKDSHRVDCIC